MLVEIWLIISFAIAVINIAQMYWANTQDDEYFHTPIGIMFLVTICSFIPIFQIVVSVIAMHVSYSLLKRRPDVQNMFIKFVNYYPGRNRGKHND